MKMTRDAEFETVPTPGDPELTSPGGAHKPDPSTDAGLDEAVRGDAPESSPVEGPLPVTGGLDGEAPTEFDDEAGDEHISFGPEHDGPIGSGDDPVALDGPDAVVDTENEALIVLESDPDLEASDDDDAQDPVSGSLARD
jgi:hypothetical protein